MSHSSSVDGDIAVLPEIIQLQEKFIQSSLHVNVTIESASQEGHHEVAENKFHDEDPQNAWKCSHDKLVHFHSNITHILTEVDKVLNRERNDRTLIILVVDRSGSMSGNPFSQVKTSLTEIVAQCVNDPNKTVEIVLYAEKAETISFTAKNYKEAILNLTAYGSTSFKAAFDAVDGVLDKRKSETFDSIVILFMTDGVDTISHQSKANEYAKKWSKSLKSLSHQITVHAVGFSKDHDLQFLTKISHAGSVNGLYRYCEPGDGPEALREKLEELFDYVSVSEGLPIKYEVHLESSKEYLFNIGQKSAVLDGEIKQNINDDQQLELSSGVCWLYTETPDNDPKFSVGIQIVVRKNKFKYTLHIPCLIKEITNIVHRDRCKIAIWDLLIMSRDMDKLTTQFVDALAAQNDVMSLKEKLDHIQSKISKVSVFDSSYDKETRAQILNHIKDIQAKLNKLYGMLAQYLRGETQSVSLLARAQDLRYEAQFSKVRRQRLMDRRVAKNFSTMKADAIKCQSASKEELKELSEEALGFYYCILSLCNVKEILLDDSCLDNALGLGLAVTRPEHVVDNPTSIRLHNISGSFVSRSSVMDALEFKINLENQLAAHGGFSFSSNSTSELPFATVGSGREPINAWLPLYICPSHWERVKSCLRPSLGYLCTLDPLGYSDSQLDIMFMVLGCMISQLWENDAGENHIKIIFALQITCQVCMEEYNLTTKITDIVRSFLQTPKERFRHAIPNLHTLIGYLVSLPVLTIKDILGFTDVDCVGVSHHSKLWVAFMAEVMRRASDSLPKLHTNDNVVTSLLNMIIHGQQHHNADVTEINASRIPTSTYLSYLCYLKTNRPRESEEFIIPVYDPSAGLSGPEMQVRQSPKVDKAMALWAQAQCGHIKDKRTEKMKEAKKVVTQWVTLVRQKIGLPIDKMGDNKDNSKQNEDRGEPFNTTAVNTSILEVVAELLCHLSQHCYPSFTSMLSAFSYLNCRLKHEQSQVKTAQNSLPSVDWIKEVKDSVEILKKKVLELFEEQFTVGELVTADQPDSFQENVTENNSEIEHTENDNSIVEDERLTGIETDDEKELGYVPVKQVNNVEHNEKSQNQIKQHKVITLSMLLAALNVPGDHTELIRAMLCQAVSYPSNTQARDAALSGELLDLAQAGNAHIYLCNIKKDLDKRKEAAVKKLAEKAAWEIGNISMLRADSLWSFIGYLLKTHKERGEGFSELIQFILKCPGVQGFPLLAEKILILLLGKYQGYIVFARGNTLIPDKKMSASFEKLLGEEVWHNIEIELLSNVHIHIYRESDIPNRHGHCNSNPYIPNRIRQILGMPLMEENINKPRTKRDKTLHKK
ncbi:hypothetical protein Btru_028346 [Bulinus truncatus]|nr:hypothetical protein Btru_028346 [Bulinus truncatus]